MGTIGRVMPFLLLIVLLLLALLLAILTSTCIFLAVGYVLSRMFPLSLLEGALLAVGASFVFVFSISVIAMSVQISRHAEPLLREDAEGEFDDDLEDECDEDDNDEDDAENLYGEHDIASSTVKIGRNSPCPCGSGRKYKLCCGK